MEVLTCFTIPRHAVPKDGDGLSPMQAALSRTMSSCTIGVAPTGSGKSYVYRRLVAAGKRVLFVVPTIQLAENQRAGMVADLKRGKEQGGEGVEDAEGMVRVFTSHEMEQAIAEGSTRALEQLARRRTLPGRRFSDSGDIIYTTPEALSAILMRPIPGAQADIGPATLMRSFDHIVFDEFHLVPARGFGLVALCAGLAANGPWRDASGRCRAKVTLLSATPVDILEVMRRLGVEMAAQDIIAEEVVDLPGDADSYRVLHGDVSVEFIMAGSHLEILEANEPYITNLPPEWGVTCIFDSLADHLRQEAAIKEFFLRHGTEGQFASSSSLAKQRIGADGELEGKRFVTATSTIEVGVTLRGLHLLIMDAGFNPLSFMQRLGRAARQDMPGRVIVRVDPFMIAGRPWLAATVDKARSCGGRMSIAEFSSFMATQGRLSARFGIGEVQLEAVSADAAAPCLDAFETLSARAVFASGLYWSMISQAQEDTGNHRMAEMLRAAAPASMRTVASWLWRARKADGGKTWLEAFIGEARNLRDFDPTVVVQGVEGQSFKASERWLVRETEVMNRFPLLIAPDGTLTVKVDADCWRSLLADRERKPRYLREVVLPNGARGQIEAKMPIAQYLELASRATARLSSRERAQVGNLLTLVKATGVVPYADQSQPGFNGQASGIL